MNKLSGLLVFSLLASFLMNAGAQQVSEKSVPQPKIVERGPGYRVWETHESVSLGFGAVHVRTNQVTELATGLHYWDGNSWADSKEEIELVGNKAVARQGNHKVSFANNIATPGAIDVVAQDGKRFRSHVLGLSYYDASTGASVLIAEIKNAEGFLLPPNQILYVDAFTDLKADIRYTYTKAGLEQDVILREAPHSPAKYGLNPDTTRLEVLTEFLQAPNRTKKERTIRSQGDSRIRNEMVSPDLVDEVLDFGSMKMGAGKAFQLVPNGHTPSDTIPVGKQWQTLEGRDFLIEAVEYPMIKGHLSALPPTEANFRDRKLDKNVKVVTSKTKSGKSIQRMLPERLVAGVKNYKPIQIAKLEAHNHGVVLDYLLLGSSATNMTFVGGSTYLVSGEVVLEETTTFEGGAVIKFTNTVSNARLRINGPVIWDTAAYRPAIFTAKDDNTVGESISGSTGSPTNYYAATALLFDNGMQNDVKHVRISHAATAVEGASVTLTHAQIVNSGNGLALVGNNFGLHNVLFSRVQTNLYSTLAITGVVEHVTFNGANYLSASATNSHLLVTNSLIYAVTNYGPFVWSTNQVAVIGGSSPFTNVGSGWSYLPTNSPYLNVGVTNISGFLRADFAEMTTEIPIIYTNLVVSDTVLFPVVARDTNQPDLGYHYYAIDYAGGVCTVTNAVLTLTNGVSFGTYDTTTFWLQDGSRLVSEGRPDLRNRFVRYSSVQESPAIWGGTIPSANIINPYTYGELAATAKFRFTDFIVNKEDWHFFTGYNNSGNWRISDLDVRDCSFYGGYCLLAPGSQTGPDFTLVNNLFERTKIEYKYDSVTLASANTHRGGSVGIYFNSLTNLVLQNSAFTNCVTFQFFISAGLTNDHNAYLNQTNHFTSTGSGDLLTNVTFFPGVFGAYYQGSDSPLINAGNQSATNLGLYHYTTQTNQTKELDSVVDIGVHYVAVDANGNPIDSDLDGIPDYLEDVNGNGIADSGETDWQNADSDYDGRTDGQELLDGTDPLNAGSVQPTRLGYWRFNDPSWIGEAGETPINTNLLSVATSWSGLAPRTTNITSRVVYGESEPDGKINFNLRCGTMRFWFKPDWTSENAGGAGNGYWNRLLNVGSWSSDNSYGAWYLGMYPSGDYMYLDIQAGGQSYSGSGVPCSFVSNQWYQIVLTYSPSNYFIYINGTLQGTNGGIGILPSATVRQTGLVVGNSWGWEPSLGAIDEFETFNYQLGAGQIAADFTTVLMMDSDYDGRTDIQEAADGTDPYDSSSVLATRLAYWKFNTNSWVGEAGQLPLIATNLSNPTNWSGRALSIDSYSTNLLLLNVDISGSTPTTMTGAAATGLATNDFWNTYYGPSVTLKTITNLLWSDQSSSSLSLTVSNAPGSWGMSTGNRMFDDYSYPWNWYGQIGVTLSNLNTGYYDFYFYCHGAASDQNAEVALYSGNTFAGGGFTEVTSDYASTNWIDGKQYVRISDVSVQTNLPVFGLVMPDGSGYAPFNGMQVISKKIAELKYRDVEESGFANINLSNGSIRFWFKPDWSGTNAGGAGPGNEVRLLEVGQKTTEMTYGWWALSINKEGTAISFDAQGQAEQTNYLTGQIYWESNTWHQVVITYTSSNSVLYVDTVTVTNGSGTVFYPEGAVRANGFNVGSDSFGLKQANGLFDELETFNYPLSGTEIQAHDSDGDGLTDGFELSHGFSAYVWNDANLDSDYDGRSNLQEQADGTDPTSAADVLPVRLGYWRFNTNSFVGEGGQLPLVATNISNPINWIGKAVSIGGYSTNLLLLNVDVSVVPLTSMVGVAAAGLDTNDFWNTYYGPGIGLKTITNLLWSDESGSTVSLTLSNASGSWSNLTFNSMYSDYAYNNYVDIGVTVSNLNTGYYDFYFYCHGDANAQNSEVLFDSGNGLYSAGITASNSDWSLTNWADGRQFVSVKDTYVSAATPVSALVRPNASIYPIFNGLQVVPKTVAQLKYRDVETNGFSNINLRNGALRFWFKPDWAGTNAMGDGPGGVASLIEVGEWQDNGGSVTNSAWALRVDPSGTLLSFSARTNGTVTNYLTATINWSSNEWHQITLNYSPSNSALYVDGQFLTNGGGVTVYPNEAARAMGFNVGSEYRGLKHAKGWFDELETFNYSLFATNILSDFLTSDVDEDRLTYAQEIGLGTDPLNPDSDGNGILDGYEDFDGDGLLNYQEYICNSNPRNKFSLSSVHNDFNYDNDNDGLINGWEVQVTISDPNNDHYYSPSAKDAEFLWTSSPGGGELVSLSLVETPIGSTPKTGIRITLANLAPGTAHDIYLIDFSAYPTIERTVFRAGSIDQTVFDILYSELGSSYGFFQSGSAEDEDNDGLSNAFELIVSFTSPTLADSDGDGIDDKWEHEHDGYDPNNPADGLADNDQDGLSNAYELTISLTDPDVANLPQTLLSKPVIKCPTP